MKQARWIRAGSYAINARLVYWIKTDATWKGEPDGDPPRDAWGEVPPGSLVERSGVEVVLMTSSDKSLRFADGTPEAEDLKRFVQAQGQEL